MASPEWIEVYRTYSDAELTQEITDLKKQKSVYSTQNIGAKGYTKDLNELKLQLHAAVRAQNERASGAAAGSDGAGSSGITDFSQVSV